MPSEENKGHDDDDVFQGPVLKPKEDPRQDEPAAAPREKKDVKKNEKSVPKAGQDVSAPDSGPMVPPLSLIHI